MSHSHPSTVLSQLILPTVQVLQGQRAAFLGCGDSLAAARPAEDFGHRVLSAGDVAWSELAPRGVDVAVALSWSGRTGATIKAAETVVKAGMPLISITSNGDSPLARMSTTHFTAPSFEFTEDIPAIGYAVHSAMIRNLLGLGEPVRSFQPIADAWGAGSADAVATARAAGTERPEGITIASTADTRGAAEFWMLKIIEATGLTVRTAPLEEIGHVDYFIGAQPHVTFILAGDDKHERSLGLGQALERNGQRVVQVSAAEFAPTSTVLDRELITGLLGADVAAELSTMWERPHFRDHAVDMSARHIQVQGY